MPACGFALVCTEGLIYRCVCVYVQILLVERNLAYLSTQKQTFYFCCIFFFFLAVLLGVLLVNAGVFSFVLRNESCHAEELHAMGFELR